MKQPNQKTRELAYVVIDENCNVLAVCGSKFQAKQIKGNNPQIRIVKKRFIEGNQIKNS